MKSIADIFVNPPVLHLFLKKRITAPSLFLPFFLCIPFLLLYLLPTGCASGSKDGRNGKYITFHLEINEGGEIDTDGYGYYAILLNNYGEEIEVTNHETYTDFIRFDGENFTWYHRQGNVPSPGYTWVNAGNLNSDGAISSDGKSIVITIDLDDDSHLFQQYIESSRFTAHVLTTDQDNSLMGRVLDTLGKGPSVDQNSLYTLYINKGSGVVNPQPPGYPGDPLADYATHSDLPSDYPYSNFDIASFTVEVE